MDVPQASPAADPVVQPGSVAPATPSPAPAPAVSPAPTDGQTPPPVSQDGQAPAAELFDLPDGRKVDAVTLQKEWKDNFLPDYTKKSQTLAEMQKAMGVQQPNINNPPQQQAPAWQDPNWVPQTYQEIVQAAAAEMQLQQQTQLQQQEQYKQQVNQFVDSQIAEIKKTEPNLSEELLFQHANKYGFGDLQQAYQNMKDFNLTIQRTQQQTVQNMQNRANDPVSVRPGQQAPASNAIDYRSISNNNQSPIDVLRRLQGK